MGNVYTVCGAIIYMAPDYLLHFIPNLLGDFLKVMFGYPKILLRVRRTVT